MKTTFTSLVQPREGNAMLLHVWGIEEQTVEWALRLDPEVYVGDVCYTKLFTTFVMKPTSGLGHFVQVFDWEGQRMSYDGASEEVFKSGFINSPLYTPDNVVYIRKL